MVDQVIILIRTCCEHNCSRFFRRGFFDSFKYFASLFQKILPIGILGRLSLPDRFADGYGMSPKLIKKAKEVRKIYPKLSKITDTAGIVCSVIMSSLLIYAVIDNTLTSLGFAYLGLFLGMIYTAIFAIAWIVEFIIMIRLK